MTAVTLRPPATAISSLRITPAERAVLRAADALAAWVHRRALRRDARLLVDLERERLLAAARMDALRAWARDVPRR